MNYVQAKQSVSLDVAGNFLALLPLWDTISGTTLLRTLVVGIPYHASYK
jgi:hypothetical protein